jgi:hypothetical protein
MLFYLILKNSPDTSDYDPDDEDKDPVYVRDDIYCVLRCSQEPLITNVEGVSIPKPINQDDFSGIL